MLVEVTSLSRRARRYAAIFRRRLSLTGGDVARLVQARRDTAQPVAL